MYPHVFTGNIVYIITYFPKSPPFPIHRRSRGEGADRLLSLIAYVKDRPGHDRRYAIDCSRIKKELGWKQASSFDEGLRKTVRWYLENRKWCENVRTGEYRTWLERNYARR